MNDSLESIINALADVAQSAANKAKSLTSIAKSNLNILTEQEKLKKAYSELGKLYYRDYVTGEEPDDAEYMPLCDKITELVRNIQGLRENIDIAKTKPEKEGPTAEELKDELDDLDEELADLEEELADLEAERSELEQARTELEAKLAALSEEAAALVADDTEASEAEEKPEE